MTAYSIPGLQTPEEIICQEYGLTVDKIKQHSRTHHLVECRYFIYNWYRKNTRMTLLQIGEKFGFDHATVKHGVQKIEDWTGYDRKFREFVAKVEKKCEPMKP